MVNLLLSDVEPRPVGIHRGRSSERALQPGIIASSKARESETAYLAESVKVVFERFAPKETASLGAECDSWLPGRLLVRSGRSVFKGETLIPAFHYGDVSEERADRVAGAILQMIQFWYAYSVDCGESRLSRVKENRDKPTDSRGVTR